MSNATAFAHLNLALIKHWGYLDPHQRISTNSSRREA
jgi:mevalonate pyrophosphate decarboxylase